MLILNTYISHYNKLTLITDSKIQQLKKKSITCICTSRIIQLEGLDVTASFIEGITEQLELFYSSLEIRRSTSINESLVRAGTTD